MGFSVQSSSYEHNVRQHL